MPLQEFWNDDPDLLWTYRTLYIEKNKQEVEMQKEIINFQAWLQGLYNYRAIGSILSQSNNIKYYEKPIDLNPKPRTRKDVENTIRERLARGKKILQQRREMKV